LADSGGSGQAAQANWTDRFPLANPAAWLLWGWVLLPAGVALPLIVWFSGDDWSGVAYVIFIAVMVLSQWFNWRAWRSKGNFVELSDNEIQIKVYGRSPVVVPYTDIVNAGPVSRVSLLDRCLWMIERKALTAHLEIHLSRPRWFVLWALPRRTKRLFLRPAAPAQLEAALNARLVRFHERAG
jgi:hypothetical protein